jgi:Protein of unknown function (DUF1573)
MNKSYKVVLLTVLTLSMLTIAIILLTGISKYSLSWNRENRRGEATLYDRNNDRTYHGEIYPDEEKTRCDRVREMPRTTMHFYETSHNYGTIPRGNVVKHTFRFKNTGENPLVICKADVHCGCTVPSFPHDAIAPGDDGELIVEINTAKKDSNIYHFQDNDGVIIHANTTPESIKLMLEGDITDVKAK